MDVGVFYWSPRPEVKGVSIGVRECARVASPRDTTQQTNQRLFLKWGLIGIVKFRKVDGGPNFFFQN